MYEQKYCLEILVLSANLTSLAEPQGEMVGNLKISCKQIGLDEYWREGKGGVLFALVR